MKKKILLSLCLLLVMLLPIGLSGCKDKTYNIYYSSISGGTIIADKEKAKSGDTITLSYEQYNGYTFKYFLVDSLKIDGNEFTMPSKDVTISARFDPIVYHITYHIDEQTIMQNNPTTYTVQTNTIQIRPAQKTGYTFIDWYQDENLTQGKEIRYIQRGSTGDLNLYPKFIKTTFNITYYLDNGVNSDSNPTSYTFDEPLITLSAATKPDHEFIGWYLTDDYSGEKITTIDPSEMKNYHLYARFLSTKVDSDGYRLIYNPTDFMYILQNENLSSGKFKLMNNIDLANQQFTPIGLTTVFSGELDGNSYKIENISISSMQNYCGFFAQINNSTIKNLTLSLNYRITNAANSATDLYLGGIAGKAENSTIENCKIISSQSLNEIQLISSPAENIYVGGIVGDAMNTTISRCVVMNTHINVMANSRAYVGGLCGRGANIVKSSFINEKDTSISLVMGNGLNQQGYIGGLIGYLSSSTSITNSYYSSIGRINIGSEQFDAKLYAGGIAGKISNASIYFTFSKIGNISAEATKPSSTTYTAGLIGEITNSTIEGCFSTPASSSSSITSKGSSTPNSYVGFLIANANSMTQNNCFADETLKVFRNEIEQNQFNANDGSFAKSLVYILSYVNSNYDANVWELKDSSLPTLK